MELNVVENLRMQTKNMLKSSGKNGFDRLERNAQMLTLSFVLNQLLHRGINFDCMHFESADSSYSHHNLIASLKIKAGHAYLILNLGWLSSQALVKGINSTELLSESAAYRKFVDAWLKQMVLMMHPELDEKYNSAYEYGTNLYGVSPVAQAQLHTQLSSVLSDYKFSLEVDDCTKAQHQVAARLSYVELSHKNIALGEMEQVFPEVVVTLYEEELLSDRDIDHLMFEIKKRWVSRYARFWKGFKFRLFQEIIGDCKAMSLPNSLSQSSVLNVQRRELAVLSL